MINKISYKIGGLLLFTIVSYFVLINFIILPKTVNYLKHSEENNSKIQLESVVNRINSKIEYSLNLKDEYLLFEKKRVKDLVTISKNILLDYYEDYKLGKISKEKALSKSFEEISKIKTENKFDYVFVIDTKGKMILHPDKRFLNRNLLNIKDMDNKAFFKELIENSIKNGSAYTKYKWFKYKDKKIANKLSYSYYLKDLDLIVVSGLYLDEIKKDEEIRKYILLKEIKDYFNKLKLENGFFYLLDKDFNFLYYPNQSFIDKNIKTLSPNNLPELIKKSALENKKITYFWNRSDDLKSFKYKLNSWVSYNNYAEVYIVFSTYETDLLHNINEIKNIIIGFSIVLFFVLFFIGLYLISKIVKPINELILNSNKVKNGNFSIRNSINSGDEIGILSEQFNFMLDKIEYNIKNLELEVSTRTKDLEKKIYYDSLTGVLNRNAFFRDVKDVEFATLILIDINNFDDVNELYGFDIGNDLLKEVSNILLEFTQNSEYKLYKVYGDVFALLSINEYFNLNKLEKMINDLNSLFFNEKVILKQHDLEMNISISIGISVCQEFPLKTANIALRYAKKSDRNFYVYNNELDIKEKIKESKYWENKIKESILEDKIVPFYQAIYDRNHKIIKYEALMRMKNIKENKDEFISPEKFLEFAKKSKQYNDINLQLIEKVLEKVVETDKQISINISFKSIQNTSFVKNFESLIENLDKRYYSKLIFEILESEFVWDYKILEDFIFRFKNMGIKIAIDDFGSGYSNFKHILNVKPDYLKIDGSLIQNIDTNNDSYELVKYISLFAKSIGIKTVAEYVHSKEIYEILYELEIDEFQGYYLGEPEKDLNI